MKLETLMVLKRLLKRWPLVGLLVVAMFAAAACSGAEFEKEIDHILAGVEQNGAVAAPTEFEGEVIVYAGDAQTLLGKINAADTPETKQDAVRDYLRRQSRIDCIFKKIGDAVTDQTDVNCDGHTLVGKKNTSAFQQEIEAEGSDAAKRAFLTDFLLKWEEDQRIERVMEGLAQIKRTRDIPLVGRLINSIHRFPIAFEGKVLVPKEDLDDLVKAFHALPTKEEREKLVDEYLVERLGLSQ